MQVCCRLSSLQETVSIQLEYLMITTFGRSVNTHERRRKFTIHTKTYLTREPRKNSKPDTEQLSSAVHVLVSEVCSQFQFLFSLFLLFFSHPMIFISDPCFIFFFGASLCAATYNTRRRHRWNEASIRTLQRKKNSSFSWNCEIKYEKSSTPLNRALTQHFECKFSRYTQLPRRTSSSATLAIHFTDASRPSSSNLFLGTLFCAVFTIIFFQQQFTRRVWRGVSVDLKWEWEGGTLSLWKNLCVRFYVVFKL